jgi:hypothetical protein
MTRHSPGRGRAPGKARASAAARSRRSKATPEANPDTVVEAAAQFAAALPAIVRTAINKAKRGKPATLLRSLTRIMRELDELIQTAGVRPRRHTQLPELGMLSPFEQDTTLRVVLFLRAFDGAGEHYDGKVSQSIRDYLKDCWQDVALGATTPAERRATADETKDAATLRVAAATQEAERRPLPQHVQDIPVLWDGIERRRWKPQKDGPRLPPGFKGQERRRPTQDP